MAGTIATPARAIDVLILGPTVPLGTSSLEHNIITTTGPVPGFTSVIGLGMSATIAQPGSSPGQWQNPGQAYNTYKAIVLGDPGCVTTPAPVAAAVANAAVWSAAVTGNVVIIGTDPTAHPGSNGISGAQLWRSAIAFAAAGPGTGAVISLSCYYNNVAPSTPVNVLNGFGAFTTQGVAWVGTGVLCANTVAIVATSPALTGLSEPNLSNWGCSVHEGFTAWPTGSGGFVPLAIATDPTMPQIFTGGSISGKVVTGFPYILARGVTPVQGILKVCKVADIGVAVGTPFTFTAGTSTFTVPAGPGPGGTCVVGPSFPVGTTVAVDEVVPAGHVVSNISVAPPGQLVGTPNLVTGTVNVMIGTGVTEVTFTDKRTGFLEICKRGHVGGNFTFNVNPGNLGPFVVPAQACSPAIEVAAGSVVIHEAPTPGIVMTSGCATIPVGNQLACNTGAQTSTVTVTPGNISTMTIAFVTNAPHFIPAGGAAIDGHMHATGSTDTTLACTPNPAPLRGAVTCTATVTAIEPKTLTPAGAVRFVEGDTTLATVPLSSDGGTAAFTTSTLAAGPHAILATYGGDANFGQSGSQFTVTIGQP